jgi:hypothetical protein
MNGAMLLVGRIPFPRMVIVIPPKEGPDEGN